MRYIATIDSVFGCHHSNRSRLFMIGGHSYRVCCDCGARFDYVLEVTSNERRDFSRPAPALCHVTALRSAH
jgi:uncharacterized membrane protein